MESLNNDRNFRNTAHCFFFHSTHFFPFILVRKRSLFVFVNNHLKHVRTHRLLKPSQSEGFSEYSSFLLLLLLLYSAMYFQSVFLLLLLLLSLSLTIVIKNAGKRIRAFVYAKRIQLSLLYAISYDIIFIRIRSSFDSFFFFFIGIKTRKTIRKNRNGGEPTKADHTLTYAHIHTCIYAYMYIYIERNVRLNVCKHTQKKNTE